MPEVLCLGELLVDLVSQTPDVPLSQAGGFLKAPGGAPANVAVGLTRMGTSAGFVGKVGDDPFGTWLRGILAAEGVDVTHLLLSPSARTTLAFIATRLDGLKDICFYRNPGADAELTPHDIKPQLFDGARMLHCGSVTLSMSPAREAQFHAVSSARQRGLLVSYDPNWRPSLWGDLAAARETIWAMMPLCDIVKVADEEWEFVTGTKSLPDGAQKIRELGPRLVVVTCGDQGAYYDCAGAAGHVYSFAAKAIDTLGAGDAFVAALLHQLLLHATLDDALNDAELRRILRYANAAGALTTQTSGAIPALPTLAEVERFMAHC